MLGSSYFMAGVFEWVQFVVDKRDCWASAEVGTLLRAFLDILCKLWEENEQPQLLDKFSRAKRRFSSKWELEKIQRFKLSTYGAKPKYRSWAIVLLSFHWQFVSKTGKYQYCLLFQTLPDQNQKGWTCIIID